MQNAKATIVAQKLLNLYRQEHVIIGGWAAVNQVFVAEATDDVIEALKDLPTGNNLAQHIQNLRSGETPMDSINNELLPYGGAMHPMAPETPVDYTVSNELQSVISEFTPDQAGLARFMQTPVIQQFGTEWISNGRNALTGNTEMQTKWDIIVQTYNAYRLWDSANEIINNPISDRIRAQLQVDMPDYETYLPMFGDAGNELLKKLHQLVSSMKPNPVQSESETDSVSDETVSPDVL